jgi:segregation and condensation protein A
MTPPEARPGSETRDRAIDGDPSAASAPLRQGVADGPSFEVRLDVFEGPFQLLLSLISEHRVDVCDVPIARLTEDYLRHIESMDRADLEVTTEFLVVAATLLALKAKALLPRPKTGDEEDEDEVERDLLIARLLEVQTFREVGEHLLALLLAGDRRFPPKPSTDDEALRQMPVLADISPNDLARVLIDVVRDSIKTVDTSRIVVDQVSTQEAAVELVRWLETDGPQTFGHVAQGRSLAWSVALFLAMLELAMRGEIDLGEGYTVGEIELKLVRA